LTPKIEGSTLVKSTPLRESKRMVYRLAALFSLDSFGGGFVPQSILALWLFLRFNFSLAGAGLVFAGMGVLSAASGFGATRIEKRLGPIRTMSFTHMPAQVLLIAAAFMPNGTAAVVCLLGRSLLASMDVPVRNAYVMSVVVPAERAAAASVTNVPRSLASALPPLAAGWMLDNSNFGWPLICAGLCKLTYDVFLLRMFDHGAAS
jgi:predicted MFS family arabinose efflux permease